MKKETLLEIILGTIGGLVFVIGMCMCLLPEWNMFTVGVITLARQIKDIASTSYPGVDKEHSDVKNLSDMAGI